MKAQGPLQPVTKPQVHYKYDRLLCGHEVEVPARPSRLSIERPQPKKRHCWKCGAGHGLTPHEKDCLIGKPNAGMSAP